MSRERWAGGVKNVEAEDDDQRCAERLTEISTCFVMFRGLVRTAGNAAGQGDPVTKAREIIMRWISLVPSPMHISGASR